MHTRHNTNAACKNAQRRGAVTVEFAIVAPLVFLLIFTQIEFCRMHMLRHNAQSAAYEGARRGIVPGATTADVIAEARKILTAAGVSGATIQVTPSTIDNSTKTVTVSVAIPVAQNAWIAPHFVTRTEFRREQTLSRERS